jgi:hypothetical protein
MERGAFNNLLLAHAQVWGFLIILSAMIVFVVIILTGNAKLDPTSKELGLMLLGAFVAKFGDMVGYLYNRQRPDAPSVVLTPEKPSDPKAP